MSDPLKLLSDSEEILEKTLNEYRTPNNSTDAQEYYEIKLQAAIFNYDVTREVAGLINLRMTGFASKLALKDLVHKLFEFEIVLSGRLIKRIVELAERRGYLTAGSDIKKKKQEIKKYIKQLQSWKALRNNAAAHYGEDIGRQVKLISELDLTTVLAVASRFMEFSYFVNTILRDIGREKKSI
ncbi:MAG: hypothetical protein PVG66_06125 [Chromatiales bacterium]|jgi:hypothetical protein